MSKIYEVISGFVTFGIGIELQLSEAQAEPRMSSLQVRRKDIYGVVSPVQFKRGERLGIYEAFLTKSLLENLKEISDKKPKGNKPELPTEYPCIKNANFGKFNVFDRDGNQVTRKPVKKDEAEKILAEIPKANQKAFEEETESNEEANGENSDVNNLPSNNQNNV